MSKCRSAIVLMVTSVVLALHVLAVRVLAQQSGQPAAGPASREPAANTGRLFIELKPGVAATLGLPGRYGIGREATAPEVAGWDIDVRPDGQGLPPGKGSVKAGEEIYMARCAACHGEFGEGAGRWPVLVGGRDTLKSDDPAKTIGSYFAYASSVFDYVRHAMPFGDAQSLGNDDLYAVVAYLMFLNDLVDDNFELSPQTFRTLKMPNAGGFYDDDRETSEKAFWNPNPCMSNCKTEARVTARARAVDVTPEDAKARKTGE